MVRCGGASEILEATSWTGPEAENMVGREFPHDFYEFSHEILTHDF